MTDMALSSFRKEIVDAFAPDGTLRVSINVGNAVLARRNSASEEPAGISVDIARDFASVLGVPIELIITEKAQESVDVVARGDADIGFFAVDLKRSDTILFSTPYLLIEGAYLVMEDSTIKHNDEVDRPGNSIVVSQGSAYDNFLSRTIQHAQIDRSAGPHNVVETFLAIQAEVAAGIRPVLEVASRRLPGLRVLEGRFMVIEQAIGISKAKGDNALAFLSLYVEGVKKTGFVADLLVRNDVRGATVANVRE
ncbi:transporter substrate-binding domain-containing protein [Paraburkholderia tropica]|uniref:transporter substrate-binding domain-containing protein n=1 Tax=Paraburkholderia tropica TaxID=92647 RepID=UPI002AB2FF32|nr:transporter substrate-binding domain-containing protein [Paraburkholderia tropica]